MWLSGRSIPLPDMMRTGCVTETTIEQRLPDGASGIQGFEIGHLPPALARHDWRDARDQAQLLPSAAVARSNGQDTSQAASSYVRADCRPERAQISDFPTVAQPVALPSSSSLAFSGEMGDLWCVLFKKVIYPRFSFIVAYGDRGH
jgi:hypothetical protein